jgi:hypothetical protein
MEDSKLSEGYTEFLPIREGYEGVIRLGDCQLISKIDN